MEKSLKLPENKTKSYTKKKIAVGCAIALRCKEIEIVLFGSYARGNYTEDSDIDIVALVHGSREDLQEKLKQVWDMSAELGLENDIIVSPTVVPYDEFMKYKQTLPYYCNIAEEGKRIG